MRALVHLARHGQTEWHAENRYAGVSDVGLTDEGRGQAAELGRWAATAQLSAVISSDLGRAVETAHIVAERAALPRRVDSALRESDFGRGEGRTRAEMAAAFPAALEAFLERPSTVPLPGGESGTLAAERFLTALRRLVDPEGDPVLVIAHTTVMRLSLCRLLGIHLDRYRAVFPELGNATLTTIELGEDDHPSALLRYNSPLRF